MFCAHCGVQVMPDQIFCSKCGQRLAHAPASGRTAEPVMQAQSSMGASAPRPSAGVAESSRMARNLSSLGAVWIIYSALRLIPGLGLFALGHMRFPWMMSPFPFSRHFFAGPFLGVLGLFVSCFAIAGIIAGWGLMAHQPWARVLALILGFITVIHFPIGTALAIYTFWVLMSGNAEAEYQRLAQAH
jgi:hypothetical protein